MTTRVSPPGLRYALSIVFKTRVTCFRYHQHTCKGILRELNCPALISRSSLMAVGVIGSTFLSQLDCPHESAGSSVLSTTEWAVPLVGGPEQMPVERAGHLWRTHHCGRANERLALAGCSNMSSWLDLVYDATTGSVSLCIWDKFDIFSQKWTAVFDCFGFIDIFESLVGPSSLLCCGIWIHCNCVYFLDQKD